MNALFYIIRKSAANWVRELVKKPGKLVLYLLILAIMTGVILITLFIDMTPDDGILPMFWVRLALFVFFTIFFVIGIVRGVSGGDAIFAMNDVNLLFVSPINPRKILFYGIFRMMKTAFAAGFFIFFQGSTLARFGIDFFGSLLIFLGVTVNIVVMLTLSLIIYCVTNGRPRRKIAVKVVGALIFAPLFAYIAFQYFLQGGDIFSKIEAVAVSPFLAFLPVSGWTTAAVVSLLQGSWISGLLYFLLDIALFFGVIVFIIKTNPDYYEDVLVATETAFEKKRALSEGNIALGVSGRMTVSQGEERKPLKLNKTGIPGVGAAAIYGKHTREIMRENKLGYLTWSSVIVAASSITVALITKSMFMALQILVWVQILLIGTGKGLRETYFHYIFMIPASSFSKIIWSNMEIMTRVLIESVLLFGISGVILRAGAIEIIVHIVVYTLFSFLLLGVNYLSMRFLNADLGNGLLVLFYYMCVIVVMAPGVVGAIVIGVSVQSAMTAAGASSGVAAIDGRCAGLALLALWELAAGSACFALSKGVLHNCDMSVIRTGK